MLLLICNDFSQYYCFYCNFDQINAALVSRRDYLQKHIYSKLLTSSVGYNMFIIIII